MMLYGVAVASYWQPPLLNLDETSISRSVWNPPGFVITKTSSIRMIDELRPHNRRIRQRHRNALRQAAIIADNVELQKALPPMFL
jgi:hypothetical protein